MSHPMVRALCGAVLGLALGACSDPVDKAAKQRIFSPEDPPAAVASAAEPLSVQALASDPRLTRRVLRMGAAEATERLGAHAFGAAVSFEWRAGERTVKLEETHSIAAGPGGVAGDFHAKLENTRQQGLEVIRAGGDVYARSRFGKFRQRLRDRGVAEREREEIYSALRDLDALMHGRLTLEPKGSATHAGRRVTRFAVGLGEGQDVQAGPSLPEPRAPKGGADETTQRRLRFLSERTPEAASGEVLVDDETAVVLKADVKAKLSAPGEEDIPRATLVLTVRSEISDIGKDPQVAAPEDFLPDADKPLGIADALDRFGIPHGQKADAGVSAPAEPPEPEDDAL